MTTTYCVYENDMIAYEDGERYLHQQEGEGAFLEEFPTREQAIDFVDGYEIDDPEIIDAPRGLDTVAYKQLEVIEVTLDDANCQDDAEYVYSRDGLTDSFYDAMRRHMKSYWDFLDYKRDYYMSLRDML